MELEIEVEKTYTLKLNKKEAMWLMGITQNSMHDNETREDGEMRSLFFLTLKEE